MTTNDVAKKKRRSPISRSEGEKRLIDATIELMSANPFADIGVRDIARAADVNHGFVHTWFGSKNDLLLSALCELCHRVDERDKASSARSKRVDPSDPETRLIGLLLLRLDAEGIDAWSTILAQPFVTRQMERYEDTWGIAPKDIKGTLLQGMFIWIAIATFGSATPKGETDSTIDADDVIDLWRHVLGLLGKHPRP